MTFKSIWSMTAAPSDRSQRPLAVAVAFATACWVGVVLSRSIEWKIMFEIVAAVAVFIGAAARERVRP